MATVFFVFGLSTTDALFYQQLCFILCSFMLIKLFWLEKALVTFIVSMISSESIKLWRGNYIQLVDSIKLLYRIVNKKSILVKTRLLDSITYLMTYINTQ